MREFTVIFHSVVQIAQFVNAVNRYPFHVWLIRGTARLDAKSLLSLCSLELHAPVTLCPDTASDLTAFCADIAPFLTDPANACSRYYHALSFHRFVPNETEG